MIRNTKSRRLRSPGFPSIIDPGRTDTGVSQPLLDLGDVGLVFQSGGGGRGAQGVRPHVLTADAQGLRPSIEINIRVYADLHTYAEFLQ